MATGVVRPSRAGTVPWPTEWIARYVASGAWEQRPLAEDALRTADATPDAVALVDGDLRLSYRELVEQADGAALRLRALGLRPDDRIIVQLPNCWEYVVLTLACLRLGVIPVMALAAHRRHEIGYLARHTEARAIAVPDTSRGFDHQAMAHTVATETPTVEQVLVAGDEVRAGSVDLRALFQPAGDPAGARRELDESPPDSHAVAVLLLSGGTTGMPKLIPRGHNDFGCLTRHLVEVCRLGPDAVNLVVLPLGHGWPLGSILATLRAGGRVVIAPSPAPEKVFPIIERERVTISAVVPAMAQRWLEYRAAGGGHDLRSMRVLAVGGSRLADHIAPRLVPTLTQVVQQSFGMSEGLVCTTRVDDPDEVIHHTQGRPICPEDEIEVVDDSGAPVPVGEPGLLLTRGPSTPRGYYRSEEHNARAFVGDGWYRTGDIVRLRPDGNLIVEGRDKDLINRGGEKISAEEVESFAYLVDGVRLAAAVAMPDPDLGERICLYAVPGPGSTVRLADIRAVMASAGVAAFKLPERLVLVDSLPVTNIGKINKKALREDAALLAENG